MTITVIVDDSDPEIAYGGVWTKAQPSAFFGDIKQSVGNTLHIASGGQNSGGSSMFYIFSGSKISVFALMTPNLVNTSTVPYIWQCLVDQNPAIPLAFQKLSEPTTIKICEFTELTDGPHEFSFSFLSGSTVDVIYFDYIEYLPTRSPIPQTFSFISFSFDDEAIIYDDTWSPLPLNDGANSTAMVSFPPPPGSASTVSTVQMQFNGSSVTWIGFVISESDTVGTYTIDSQPQVQFSLPQYANNITEETLPGRVFFETTQLATAPHNMSLRYPTINSKGDWEPMSVQSIIIGNGTVPALIPNTTAMSSAPRGAIIAGALSGVFTVVVIIALAVILRRRRGQTQRQHPSRVVQAFSSQPSPLLARLITFPSVTTIDIKGRRRLLPVPVPPGIIPPSKLVLRPTDTSTQAPDERDPVHPATENAQAEEAIDNIRDPPARVTRMRDVQEEDSGLRLVEQRADGEEEIIRVLPPVYTAV